MNIDVREYLRINPISVHELTLSDNDNDCFLFFPTSPSTRGYMALKQSDLFTELKKSIFGGLLDYSQDPPKIETSGVTEDDIAGKFKNYVRRNAARTFMDDFDGKLNTLENGLDSIILALRRKGILDYAGAVELQSNNTRKLSWTSGMGGPLYKNMSYSLGQIWCKTTDSNKATTGGSDEVSIGNAPLRHKHPDTMAETLTGPLSDKFGGGQLMGDFTIGSKELVAQGTKYGPSTGGKATPLEHATNEALTYPLWGQNILDWRNSKKEHNNVPPSLNIYVRYWAANQSSVRGLAESTETYEEIIERIAKIREVQVEDGKKKNSAAESRYDSAMVCELPYYVEENLTPHDYILRIAYDGKQQIQLWRQGLQMLLDIFSDKTNKELSTESGSMKDLLMKLLDGLLMTVSEFMQWYNQATNRLDAIEEKIEIAEQLCKSVPPLNYIGRIIISYTDDTEQKVIANYGGKSWRRIENFLRGVGVNDPNNIPGQKTGEEFVALRESNIPIHSHTETLSTEESQITTQQQEWMAKNKGGNAKIVNTTLASSDTRNSVKIENTNRNYQISPLEYPSKEANEITLPHDNLPPYMKMYIWECTELTDEERRITGEPKDNKCVITWLYNGGKVGSASSTTQQRTIGGNHSSIPTPTYANHDFLGWKDMSGQIKTNEQIIATPISGNEIYVAQWESSELLVTFNSNGAQPEVMKRKYAYGKQIGYFPTMDEWPEKAVSLDGWYTSRSGGNNVKEYSEVTDNITLYAHWTYAVSRKFTVKFYHYNENSPYKTIERAEGTRLGDMDNPTRLGYTFKGWFTAKTGGNQVFATQKVYNNLNLYEQWIADTCTITWNPNYTGSQKFTWEREYDSALGTLPLVTRSGYNQDNWWTATSGGSKITTATVVKASVEYFAHWNKISYNISYDLKGGSWNGTSGQTSYNVESPNITIPTPKYTGRNFLGWTGSNGSTPQLSVTIPTGSTGNKSYVANWNIGTYTVEFLKNNSSAKGTMIPQTFAYDTYQKLKENAFSDTILVSFDGNGGVASETSLTSFKQFLGWATTSTGAKAYNDQQSVKNLTTSSSTTLYAVWSSAYDKIYLPNATRTGYTFANWYTAASGGTNAGGNGAQYQPPGNITLYAHWTANKYNVTFDGNGGRVIGTSPREVTYGDSYGALPSAEHDEYAFNGWFTDASAGNKVEFSTIVAISSDHTLYAHWKDGKMTLTFNANLGYFEDDVPQTRRCWIGQAFSYERNTPPGEFPSPVRPGYQFSGWYSDDETFEREVVSSDNAPEEDMEIFANWTPNFYIIRFNANGGSGEMADQIVQYGTRDQLKTNQFTYDGGTFNGWALSPSGNVRWEDNDTIVNLSKNLGDVINVYAIWYSDPIRVTFNSNWDQYTMTFNANGGVGGWSKRLDASTQITTPTVTRENYDFIGWSPTPPTTMPENDVTCIAQWRQQAITAKITTSKNRATCSDVNPPDATVQYSTTNATSGYNNGSTFTLAFESGTTQTKSGWFKLSKSGLTDAIYKVSITQTVSKNWSAWVAATGLSGNDVATELARLKSLYGEGNFELDVHQISDHHYSARERHVIGTQTSYSSTTEKIS